MTVSINGTSGLVFNDASTQNTAATGFGFKNRIINGAMMIDQRNAGASVTTTAGYTLDRWGTYATQTGKATIQRNAGSVTPPTGFTNYVGVTVDASANVTIGAADLFQLYQPIEGFNVADLAWGTASASPVSISFWVRSSLTGTFSGSLYNAGSFPFSYVINAANTWEYKTVSVSANTAFAIANSTTGTGVTLNFDLGAGSNYTATAGSWGAGTKAKATGSVNLITTNSATFYITGVQLEKGSTATSFDYRPITTEIQLCQRYFEKNLNIDVKPQDGVTAGTNGSFTGGGLTSFNTTNGRTPAITFQVSKRAAPTLTFYRLDITTANGQWGYYNGSWINGSSTSAIDGGQNASGFAIQLIGSFSTNASHLVGGVWTASAEL
jgi:hypothetical protein